MIRKEQSKWVLYSKDGTKKLGEHDTEEEARKQEAAIEIAKHARKDSVRRFDRGELYPPTVTPEGWLKADAYIARSGVLEYTRTDGSVQREYRPPEEAFRQDALDSFSMVPLTNGHPPTGLLTAENTKVFQVGTVGAPRKDGDKIRTQILITDSAAVLAAKQGKAQLSCGYVCDLEFESGEINGQRYDAIQKNVRGNHVALVWEGRAGPEVRLRVDSSDAELVESPNRADFQKIGTEKSVKVKIDGVEYDLADTAAQAYAKVEAQRTDEAKAAKDILEREKARADAAESEVAKLRAALDAEPARIRAQMEARSALVAQVKGILGEELKADAADLELKRAAAEKVLGLKLDGKEGAYVEASFDLALKRHADETKRADAYRGTSSEFPHKDGDAGIDEARRSYNEALKKHFKK